MTCSTTRRAAERHEECSQGRDPAAKMGNLVITGSAVGGLLSIGLFVIVWGYVPVVRPFLIGALVVGGIFGFILWVRRQ
jgi:hypothetical protein